MQHVQDLTSSSGLCRNPLSEAGLAMVHNRCKAPQRCRHVGGPAKVFSTAQQSGPQQLRTHVLRAQQNMRADGDCEALLTCCCCGSGCLPYSNRRPVPQRVSISAATLPTPPTPTTATCGRKSITQHNTAQCSAPCQGINEPWVSSRTACAHTAQLPLRPLLLGCPLLADPAHVTAHQSPC